MPYHPAPPDYSDPRFRQYLNAIVALGPINTDERAKEYQRLFEEFHDVKLCAERTNQISG
jgi:hypothetical protein